MKPEEAVKELGYLRDGYIKMGWETEAKAAGLGIEALKLNMTMRETYPHPELLVLPGEAVE